MVEIVCPYCREKFDPGMGIGMRMLRGFTNDWDVICPNCHMKVNR